MLALPFIILVDLLILNSSLFFYRLIGLPMVPDRSWLLINLLYLVCILVIKPVSHKYFSRVETVAERTFTASALFFFLYAIHLYTDKGFDVKDGYYILFAVTTALVIFFGRYCTRSIIQGVRKEGRNARTIIYIGAGKNLAYLYKIQKANLGKSFQFQGYFNDEKSTHLPEDAPWLGTISEVLPWLEKNKPHTLYCNLSTQRSDEIYAIMRCCEQNLIHFRTVANVRNYLNRTLSVQMLDDMPVLMLHREPLNEIDNRIIKRSFDLLVSAVFLVTCFWWIYLIVALVTKITMPGPVLFRQKRNGLDGKEFTCLKFRSMKINDQADTLQATKDDPRKTKWGNIMRKTNIDELPQFINVLLGDMSIVGPRPHMVKHTEEYSALIEKYMVRHWVKPGITGWAQVTGARGETEELWQMEERIEKDIWYIEHWSIWLDLRIIAMTVINVFGHEKGNAY